MKQFIIDLFKLEKKPVKGLMAYEWVVMAYLVLTLIVIFFMYTTINNPQAMIFGRLRIVALTAAMWVVYRLAPCRATRFLRVGVQLGLLAWWYPDTFEINRHLPNPRPSLCAMGARPLWLSASIALLKGITRPSIQRVVRYGLCSLLSYDSCNGCLLLRVVL